MRGIRGIACVILAAVLSVAGWAMPAFAEETATASVMRLEMTEGETQVRNSAGRVVTVRDGGKLYSGYELTTEEGYIWISLDEDKLIKLDWNSQVTVKKTGKNYQVLVEYGSIFFDVEKPLEEDETLDIRTSTLSTGVRGTMGIVSSQPKFSQADGVPQRLATVELLEGKVTLAFYPLSGGAIETHELTAGSLATLVSTQPGEGDIPYLPLSELTLVKRTAGEALAANPFALVEFARDQALGERLLETESITREELDQLVKDAENLLNEANQAAEEKQQEEEERFEQAVTEEPVTDPVFGDRTEKPAPTATAKPAATPGWTRPAATPTPAPTPTPVATPAPGSGGSDGEGSGGGNSAAPPKRTVTFQCNGTQFAAITVQSGDVVEKPLIQPTEQGAWTSGGQEYDFTKPVEGDLTLVWQEQP